MPRVDVELGVKNAGFRTGIAQASAAVEGLEKKWGNLMKFGALGFSAGAAVAGLKSVADEFDRVGKLATQLGQTPETVQRLGFVASQTGTDLESMATALTQVNRKLSDLANNAGPAKAAESLGINIQKFLSLDAQGQLGLLADAYKNATSKGKAFSDLNVLLEEDARKLLPAFELGASGINSLASSISVLSDTTVRDIEAMNDALDKFGTNLKVTLVKGAASWVELYKEATGQNALEQSEDRLKSLAETASRRAGNKADRAARVRAAIDAPTGAEAFGLRQEALQPLRDAIAKTQASLALSDSPLADQLAAAVAQLDALKAGFLDLAEDDREKSQAEILALTKQEYDLRKKIAEQDAEAAQAVIGARAEALKQESAARENWTAQALAEVEAVNSRIAAVQGSVGLGSLRSIGGGSANINLDAETSLTAKLSKQADDARASYAQLRKSSEALAAAADDLGKKIVIPSAQFRGVT